MMNNRELDALVAEKVMEWQVHPRNTAHWMHKDDDQIGYKVMGIVGEWNPSRDIAAAWQVVEKMIQEGYFEMSSWPNDYHVNFTTQAGSGYVKSKTAPLAICLAALKAVGVTVE